MNNAPTTATLCQGIIAAGLHDPRILDALMETGVLGTMLGGTHSQDEAPSRRKARKKAEAIPPNEMGLCTRYGHAGGYNTIYNDFGGDSPIEGPITDEGLPVPVTRHMSPYAYSTFVQYDDGSTLGDPRVVCPELLMFHSNSIIRMEKYDKLAKEHFDNRGHYWDDRQPDTIENFLRVIVDEPKLVLRRILQGCNASSGYPFWIFKVTPTTLPTDT
jgi:hypothetical protein